MKPTLSTDDWYRCTLSSKLMLKTIAITASYSQENQVKASLSKLKQARERLIHLE